VPDRDRKQAKTKRKRSWWSVKRGGKKGRAKRGNEFKRKGGRTDVEWGRGGGRTLPQSDLTKIERIAGVGQRVELGGRGGSY